MGARVRLVMPYFGPWPRVFPLFLDSCRRNPNLEWRLITDQALPPLPPNVRHVPMSQAEVLARIEDTVGIRPAPIVRRVKLCDFRPAFGVIFARELRDAEFWGYGDLDLIYGHTARFVTDARLDAHDVLSFRPDWIHGPFTLLRNTPAVNQLYAETPHHRRYFAEPHYFGFDECNGRHRRLEAGEDILAIDPEPTCMTGLVRAAARDGRLRLHTEMAICERLDQIGELAYRDGELRDRDDRPYLLYHLFREKRLHRFTYPAWPALPERFHITDTGFYSEAEYAELARHSRARRRRGALRAAASVFTRLPGRIRRAFPLGAWRRRT